jgi:PIN domain nuclease of toxin-antitoxin system
VTLLLDTNAFIMLVERRRLPAGAAAEVDDDRNDLYLSPWEMQIKIGLGKLTAARPVRQTIDAEVAAGTFELLPITLDHIDALSRLPNHHRDPSTAFDRAGHSRRVDDRHRRRNVRPVFRSRSLAIVRLLEKRRGSG